jgi:hypothetical protein
LVVLMMMMFCLSVVVGIGAHKKANGGLSRAIDSTRLGPRGHWVTNDYHAVFCMFRAIEMIQDWVVPVKSAIENKGKKISTKAHA